MSRSPVDVIQAPLVTEKTYALYQAGRYTFRVSRDATKPEIAQAIQEHYPGVKVTQVHTISMRGKTRRSVQRGVKGTTPEWKKAIVTLGPGQKLEGLFGTL
jgi:large subunit ribosomal protein L23